MPIIACAGFALDQDRRWGALGLFRLASTILRRGLALYERGKIFKSLLCVTLAVVRCAEHAAAVALLGRKRPQGLQDHNGRDQP